MGKPNSYNVPNPEDTVSESKHERKERERREKKFRKAAFRLSQGQLQEREATHRRHAEFDDKRQKGGRQNQNQRAIDESRDN